MAGDLIQSFRRTLAKIAEIEKRIATDKVELAALRGEIEEIRSALRAVAPDHPIQAEIEDPSRRRPIRTSSSVGYAKRVLMMVGEPMHVNEIIKNIEHMSGQPVNKATLVSNLARYVINGDTFIRTAPNTYGLVSYEDDPEKGMRLVG